MNKKKILLIVGGIFLLLVVIGLAGGSDEVKETAKQGYNDGQQAFSENQDINEGSVKSALNNLEDISYGVLSEDYITEINVNDMTIPGEDGGEIYVNIVFSPNALWNEKDFLNRSAGTSVAVMQRIFANPKVDRVQLTYEADFTDQFGNSEKGMGVNVQMSRVTADKIDWDGFKELVLLDYNNFFNVVDSKNIRPSLLR